MIKRIRKALFNYAPLVIKTAFLKEKGFLYPFLRIEPSSCTILITDKCNLKCIMCNQWRAPSGEGLKADEWKAIIDDLKKNKIKSIHFSGGEPLLRGDLGELIFHGSRNGFAVGLTTNGILLTEEILNNFIDSGLRSIAVSMDGVGAEYEKIRGVPNSFEKLKKAVLAVSEAKRKRKIDASINFTLMKNNMKSLKGVKEFADRLKLPVAVCLLDKTPFIFDLKENRQQLWISGDKDFGDLRQTLRFLREEKKKDPGSLTINFPAIDFIEDYFKDPLQARIPCVSSQDRIIIDPKGNLLGGCMSMGTFGNLRDRRFSELKKTKKYTLAKKNMFYKNCPGCSCGYAFNIRCLLPLMIEDLMKRMKFR